MTTKMKEKKRRLHLMVFMATITGGLLVWQFAYLFSPTPAILIHQPPRLEQYKSYNYTYPMQQLAANDYHSLVNYSFNFSILHQDCSEGSFLLVLVHSSPGNFKKRSVIRSTWGGNNNCSDCRMYFMLGQSSNSTVQKALLEEDEAHGDLIQGSFLDQYRNLTYKHVMSLKYAIYHCPQAKYILKTDDDVFVNVPLLKRFLTADLSLLSSELLYCSVIKSAPVYRSYRSKWRVRFDEYPFRTYPDYCFGWAILYSPDVVFVLYKSAQNNSEVFWIDDVFITGILAQKNNLTHTDSTDTIISEEDQVRLVGELRMPEKPFLFGRSDLSARQIKRMWLGVNKKA